MVGVQAAAEAANNASTGDNTSPRGGCGHPPTRSPSLEQHVRGTGYNSDYHGIFDHVRIDSARAHTNHTIIWSDPLRDLDSDIVTSSCALHRLQILSLIHI